MIHAYHIIFGTYGFWLPNDPRGSWSDFVGSWELVRFGKSTWGMERIDLTAAQKERRHEARNALKYPHVHLSGIQARAVGRGFANAVRRSDLTVWACSVLPEHVHLVIARHKYRVEHVVNQLKGAATKQLKKENLHPLIGYVDLSGQAPSPWAHRECKVYLDSEEAIDGAIAYVVENPSKEGKPRQNWSFVKRFEGLDTGWTTYY